MIWQDSTDWKGWYVGPTKEAVMLGTMTVDSKAF